jgi:hypothetical protein
MIDRFVKALPFALVSSVTALLIVYAFGGLTGGQLFRGLLAACAGFILLIVLALWIKPSKPTLPAAKPPPWCFTAEGPIAKGDLVIVSLDGKHVFTAMDDNIKPMELAAPLPEGPVQ